MINGNKYIKPCRRYIIHVVVSSLLVFVFSGCFQQPQLNTYEKHVSIPGYSWDYDFRPSFSFRITDTAATYNISVTVRNDNAYAFSNLWLLISSGRNGEKPKTQRVELPLADREGRWLGVGMDGIYDHRIPIQRNARFDRPGTYDFSFEQNMRTNPLLHIMSIGLRVEKISH